jgi:hypothetical protein
MGVPGSIAKRAGGMPLEAELTSELAARELSTLGSDGRARDPHIRPKQRAVALGEPSGGARAAPSESFLADIGPSIATEQYTVAMTLVTFLVILSTALLYQGAVSGSGLSGYLAASVCSMTTAGALAHRARRRFRARLRALGNRWGLTEREAITLAHRDLAGAAEDRSYPGAGEP